MAVNKFRAIAAAAGSAVLALALVGLGTNAAYGAAPVLSASGAYNPCQWYPDMADTDPRCVDPGTGSNQDRNDPVTGPDEGRDEPPTGSQTDREQPPAEPQPTPCRYNPTLTANDPGCVQTMCEYNPRLGPDDPNCVPQTDYSYCRWDPQLLADDENCGPVTGQPIIPIGEADGGSAVPGVVADNGSDGGSQSAPEGTVNDGDDGGSGTVTGSATDDATSTDNGSGTAGGSGDNGTSTAGSNQQHLRPQPRQLHQTGGPVLLALGALAALTSGSYLVKTRKH